jgi:hypothetical protein
METGGELDPDQTGRDPADSRTTTRQASPKRSQRHHRHGSIQITTTLTIQGCALQSSLWIARLELQRRTGPRSGDQVSGIGSPAQATVATRTYHRPPRPDSLTEC